MASRIEDFTKSDVLAKAFGRGFRCAKESLRKYFRATPPAFAALFMQLASLYRGIQFRHRREPEFLDPLVEPDDDGQE